MNKAHRPFIHQLRKPVGQPGFWFIIALLALITVPHYAEVLPYPAFLHQVQSNLGLSRHAFERILYLAPIIWAGFLFGWLGAVITSLAALACMLPRALFISLYRVDSIFEISAVFVMGNLLAVTFNALHKERARRAYLSALNQTSSVVSQSLELSQVLSKAIENVMDVMRVDSALVYLLDETGELTLAAHLGISTEVAQGVGKLKLGEGLNGMVAMTGEPLFVEDASQDPRITRAEVIEHEIRSVLIVPMRSKDKVNGTLCIGMRSHRSFQREEMELLVAIGNQVGVAVENARLYHQQQVLAEQLRASQERYQELFESAYDAIWVQDVDGKIVTANRAATRLTGYPLVELIGMNVRDLLSAEGLEVARKVRRRLLQGEVLEPYEQKLVKKDGSEAFIQLATSLVFSRGEAVAFQHIARDITEQKQLEENLRFYLEQVTRAQEEERKRISRELHDDTVQALVVLSRQLDSLTFGDKGLSEEDRLRIEEIRRQINDTIKGVRRLSQDLRPAVLDRLGLLPALEWLAADVAQYSGTETKVNVLGAQRRLPAEVELVLFRIVQEALRNVWRHSHATKAEITVEFDKQRTKIAISDNGKGFDPPKMIGSLPRGGKLGLAGMYERAQLVGGTLTVQSQSGKGCTVTIELSA